MERAAHAIDRIKGKEKKKTTKKATTKPRSSNHNHQAECGPQNHCQQHHRHRQHKPRQQRDSAYQDAPRDGQQQHNVGGQGKHQQYRQCQPPSVPHSHAHGLGGVASAGVVETEQIRRRRRQSKHEGKENRSDVAGLLPGCNKRFNHGSKANSHGHVGKDGKARRGGAAERRGTSTSTSASEKYLRMAT